MDEPLSCEYVVHVYTNRLCKVAKFRPPPQPKPKEIKCHPMLTDEEFAKFEEYEKGWWTLLEFIGVLILILIFYCLF